MRIRNYGSFVVNARSFLIARCGLLVLGCSLLADAKPAAINQQPVTSSQLTPLWQIGKADGSNAEFALAPGGYAQFRNDGFYVVGGSDAKKDWPYVQPGPADGWAGGPAHTFVVLFGLKARPAAGECRLQFNLIDTHSSSPPKLRVEVNGQPFEQSLPAGAGDASVFGQPEKGRRHEFIVTFPESLLKTGDNEIRITTVSGSWMLYDSIGLSVPAGAELGQVQSRTLLDDVRPIRALREQDGKMRQPVLVTVRHFGEDADAVVRLQDEPAVKVHLKAGSQEAELMADAVETETKRLVTAEVGGKVVASREITLKPVKKLTVYILPHSHTDIGYTEIQTDIEEKQVNNLLSRASRRPNARPTIPTGRGSSGTSRCSGRPICTCTGSTSSSARSSSTRSRAARSSLNGMYLNELTGLCRPEELLRLFRYATQLARADRRADRLGDDQRRARLHLGHGHGHGAGGHQVLLRRRRTTSTASAHPARVGEQAVLLGRPRRQSRRCWSGFRSGATRCRTATGRCRRSSSRTSATAWRNAAIPTTSPTCAGAATATTRCPIRPSASSSRTGTRSTPGRSSSSPAPSEAFRAFEQRYGDKLPQVRGDWTPYWEDGAGSSALETAMNRASSDRLVQAETLWAMLKPAAYPAAAFEDAWNNVLLYSEHTWGAWCSVSEPERQETSEQWDIKQSYALAADLQSRELLAAAAGGQAGTDSERDAVGSAWTSSTPLSWPRTELVTAAEGALRRAAIA